MKRREQWRPVLDVEAQRWKAKSCDQLVSELVEVHAYEVEFEGKVYQVEVQVLEDTDKYLHVGISVDDGSIPASFHPLSESFIRQKPQSEEITVS